MKQTRTFLSTSLPNRRDSPSRIIKDPSIQTTANGTLSEQLRPSVIQTGHWEIIIFYPASVITFHRASTVNLDVLVIPPSFQIAKTYYGTVPIVSSHE